MHRPEEYQLLDRLEGCRLTKNRYDDDRRDHVFSVDVFEGELEGLILSEVEADSLDDLMKVEPPDYIACEVTEHLNPDR